ncbi:putative toxin-antitoxin system toxin component, PIN family [Hymenobacter sp. UV11]|uniref:putative toxin-antitoxin system toxin component, PIN family n=1 Tax=Hymenobacter sp. UV11 TaxID=1849735 RepID=UPI0010618BCF|nr:putative toxin-antitoxin system toxin component, PIN family [Hymenobacter sp. UV11]TDN40429.1 putative toxin-antitoxin system toxin component, PIN family [Hymenobacter sp. UV11]TFZ66564.1 putative toxin-antitoxin system toxin component, PIN family [Hymenobacter sp. UV11]
MPRYVIDTNVLLVCVSNKSSLHWIYSSFRTGAYELCVTTEILAEYAEILERHMGPVVSRDVLNSLTTRHNLIEIEPTYRFNLLNDPDDNKFVDCAIAANAVCIVSHDRDFLPLRSIEFPKVVVVDTVKFNELLSAQTIQQKGEDN